MNAPHFIRFYPVEAFPLKAREVINELADNVQAPLDIVALSVLSAMSAVSQARVKVSLPIGGQPKPVSLFILAVAVSGDRKTTVDNLVFRSLREYDNLLQEQYELAMKRYRCEHRVWSAKERYLIRQVNRDDDENESLRTALEAHYEIEPNEPRLQRQVRQNASERAVIDALAGSGESFTLISDEGGVVLRSPLFRNSAFLNKIWDGGPVILDRAHGVSLAAKDTRVTASIMVQPQVLQDFVRDHGETLRGSGFFARFLMSRPQSRQGSRIVLNADFSWPALDKFHEIIASFLAQKDPNDRVLEFDEDAKRLWIDFVNQTEMEIRPGGCLSEINDFASKVGEIVARVAAIFHYFGNQEGCISSDTVKRAIDVVCYHVDEFRKAFDPTAQVPQALLDARKIHDYLHRHCWNNQFYIVDRNYILRNGPVRGKDRFDTALAILCTQGVVFVTCDKKRKRYINLSQAFLSSSV